jgi:hypothetical protein
VLGAIACAVLVAAGALILWLVATGSDERPKGPPGPVAREPERKEPSTPVPSPQQAPGHTLLSLRAHAGDNEKLMQYLETPPQRAAVTRGGLAAVWRLLIGAGEKQ